jgi:hypothetical protein
MSSISPIGQQPNLPPLHDLCDRWKYTIMQDGWKEKKLPTPCEVIEVVTGSTM